MSGYTELLYTMLAMVLVSTLVINANRIIMANYATTVDAELENQVIAIAQDYIDESRATTFDAATVNGGVPVSIPGGFTALGPGGGENTRAQFNDFDDYDGWEETISASGGVEYNVSIDVDYFDEATGSITNSRTTLKQMTIRVTSDALTNNGKPKSYRFQFLRSFYAD